MSAYSLPNFIISIYTLSLGIFVLFSNPKAQKNQVCFLLTLFSFSWLFSYATVLPPCGAGLRTCLDWACLFSWVQYRFRVCSLKFRLICILFLLFLICAVKVIPFKSPLTKGDSGSCVFSGVILQPPRPLF